MEGDILKNSLGVLIVTGFLGSLGLLFFPKQLRRLNDYLNKWVSTRNLLRALETVRNVDDGILKRSKIIAIVLLAVTLFLAHYYIIL